MRHNSTSKTMSHSYNTRYQALKAAEQQEKKAAEPQEEKKEEKNEPQEEKQEEPVWYTVRVPTCGMYKYQNEDIFRLVQSVPRLLVKMDIAYCSLASATELFDHLYQYPCILIIPKIGLFIQQRIKEIKPTLAIYEEQHIKMCKAHGFTHEVMNEMSEPTTITDVNFQSHQPHSMKQLQAYVECQKISAKWAHLKDIIEKLEKICAFSKSG
jgi:hypothetical protein